MKKISIFLTVVCMAMVSCGNSYDATTVALGDMNDSINYALGFVNGASIKQYYMANDSSEAAVTEFMDALIAGYEGTIEEQTPQEMQAQSLAGFVKECEKKGLAEKAAWAMNEKIFFQAFINGILADTSVMTPMAARDYFQQRYYVAQNPEDGKVAKAIKGSCPIAAKTITLSNEIDSLNYAFGMLNGDGMGRQLFANDSTGTMLLDFVNALNKELKTGARNPQLVQMAQSIGKNIKEQEPQGLLQMPEVVTDFALIRQGFINGLKGYNKQMDMEEANLYIQHQIEEIKYGKNREEGVLFLEQNAQRPEVTVTESGLQYEVLKQGKGKKPTTENTVRVHYHGTLIDGTVFDSSVDRGEPAVFGVTQVIPGWTEVLQLMPVGSKYKVYIPQELGYGNRPAGSIPPYSTLIFEVELLGIE